MDSSWYRPHRQRWIVAVAHSKDIPLITSGQIALDLPGLPHATIGPDGEANFKGISAQFEGKPIRLWRTSTDMPKWQTRAEEWRIRLDVDLEQSQPVTLLTGAMIAFRRSKGS